METGIIIIVILILAYIVFLLRHYEPSIDVVVENNRYRVLLWYNKLHWNNFTKKYEVWRGYIRLFKI